MSTHRQRYEQAREELLRAAERTEDKLRVLHDDLHRLPTSTRALLSTARLAYLAQQMFEDAWGYHPEPTNMISAVIDALAATGSPDVAEAQLHALEMVAECLKANNRNGGAI